MTKQKKSEKQRVKGLSSKEISERLEDVFLAGIGALSRVQEAGENTFETLVKDGKTFRKRANKKADELIGEVQESIKNMTGDTQSRATGLVDQMRKTAQLDNLQSSFDARVEAALSRLGVATRSDLEKLEKRLDSALKKKTTKKAKRSSTKKVSKKKPSATRVRTKKKTARKKTTK